MRSVNEWLMPLLLTVLVVWRAPTAFATPTSRTLWCTLVCIDASQIVRIPLVDRLLQDASGVGDITQLLKHLTGIAGTSFMLDFVHTVNRRASVGRRRVHARHLLAIAAACALTVLYVVWLPHDAGGYGIDAHFGEPAVLLYMAIFYAFLATSAAQATVLFWSNRDTVEPGLLRAGILCLAGATATTVVYTVYRIWLVLHLGNSRETGPDGKPVLPSDTMSEILPALAMVLLALGITLPPTRTFLRYLRDQCALWRLHPLWADLVHAVPHVVLGTPTSRLRGLFTSGDRSLDVAHRAFAIRDAALALRDGAPPGPPAAPGEDPALTEARWLCAAVRQRGHGLPSPGLPSVLDGLAGGRTPREEVAWLLRIAAHYRTLTADTISWTRIAILPRTWPSRRRRIASGTSGSGYVRSTTGVSAPDSMNSPRARRSSGRGVTTSPRRR